MNSFQESCHVGIMFLKKGHHMILKIKPHLFFKSIVAFISLFVEGSVSHGTYLLVQDKAVSIVPTIASEQEESQPSAFLQKEDAQRYNPIRLKAKKLRSILETIKKKESRSLNHQIQKLIEDAEMQAAAFESASIEHDVLMKKYEEGELKSGQKAIQLSQKTFEREQVFSNIIDQIESILKDSMIMDKIYSKSTTLKEKADLPHSALGKEPLPPSPKSVPVPSSKFGKLDNDFDLSSQNPADDS